jgi:hypothetical protein
VTVSSFSVVPEAPASGTAPAAEPTTDIRQGEPTVTVYVDNYRAPARVGRVRGRWSHLTADTPDELHLFAARLGLRREWFQGRCRAARCTEIGPFCVHFHYDVVDRVRARAIDLGATSIDIREFGALITARRAAWRRTSEPAR